MNECLDGRQGEPCLSGSYKATTHLLVWGAGHLFTNTLREYSLFVL